MLIILEKVQHSSMVLVSGWRDDNDCERRRYIGFEPGEALKIFREDFPEFSHAKISCDDLEVA